MNKHLDRRHLLRNVLRYIGYSLLWFLLIGSFVNDVYVLAHEVWETQGLILFYISCTLLLIEITSPARTYTLWITVCGFLGILILWAAVIVFLWFPGFINPDHGPYNTLRFAAISLVFTMIFIGLWKKVVIDKWRL